MGVDLPPALMDLLLKGTILLAAGGLITSAMRRASAASRHAVWAATCVAALALPVARVVAPEVTVAWWPGAEAVDAAVAVTGPAGVGVAGVAVAVGDGLTASPLQPMVLALLLVWGSGAVVLLGRLVRGRLAWSRLQRQTTQETDARIQGRADLVAGWMGLLRCRVQRGPDDWMPVTWGLCDPVVALPGTARRWTDARLDIVLVHELAHVRRADAWWLLMGQLMRAVWWLHPLAWIAVRQLRVERERACDDLVLSFGTRARDYATDLVSMAGECGEAALDAGSTLAMARRTQLEGRVMAILNPRVNRNGRTMAATLTAAGLALALVPVSGLRASIAEGMAGVAPLPVQAQQPAVRIGGNIGAPKKIKHVNPIYPAEAIAAGVQGIVIIEVIVDGEGLVSDLKVIRPVELLTAAAEDAVRQWEFTPTLLNGTPVPVVMTVTVNFRLADDGQPAPPPAASTPPSGNTGEPLPAPAWNEGDPPLRIGGDIREPRKIKHVNPVYPPGAKAVGVQGIVIVELDLDKDGRVSGAKILRHVDMLDDAALDAVLQWEFQPTLLNGMPVPVIMTVTVNFTLK